MMWECQEIGSTAEVATRVHEEVNSNILIYVTQNDNILMHNEL